jgi:dTDP-glucose 4,6-dehydratase
VLKVTGSSSSITYNPLPIDDPKQRRPDISKARTQLGWEPKIDLETGLKLSMQYFQQAIEIEDAEKAGRTHTVAV